ncbi:hypothetical protein [Bosea minatitlanensis]|uniref:Uncharacterized protein n=1 Tax=Bosea minatitlanensis TaxID=128782 RepID=A0ABW0EYT2_9HYPH|nr:hypothetical protein [Bosea minatitlanensis]MCT4496040.1 hypothetical protein [Bosea minatitlanensis]
MGRTKTQSYCLVAARSGKLYVNNQGTLVMRQASERVLPVRTFSKGIVKQCEKAGWITRIPNHGWERIMTTPAGDRELEKPLRLMPFSNSWQDAQREALR